MRFSFSVLIIMLLPFNMYASERLALVIGNNKYATIPSLNKAVNDAESIANILGDAGFKVSLLKNATYRNTVKAIDSFARNLKEDDVAVFFFAGHGVQLGSGNYILPVDASNQSMVEKTSYSLDDITFLLGKQKSGFQLIIVDACRDNPFPTKTRSFSSTRGLIPVEAVKGQMIIYSASRGQQALDRLNERDTNPNGVFTRKFIENIREEGKSALEIIRNLQDQVEELAASVQHEQRPAVYNESRGDFYFFGEPSNYSDPDTELWHEVKTIGNFEAFELYISSFPKGNFIRLARAYISKLKNSISLDNVAEKNALRLEMDFWNSVKQKNTYKDYESYIEKYPAGYFVSVAQDFVGLLDAKVAIDTFTKYATAEEMEKVQKDRDLYAMTRKKVENENIAITAIAKKLIRLDIPSF